MFAICIESSHQRGMGHLFRALNFAEFLDGKNSPYLVLVNNDRAACDILKSRDIRFEAVDLTDIENDWETEIIQKYAVNTWINDRLDTDKKHAKNVKKNNIKLITLDDRGEGAELADINFAPLVFDNRSSLKGHKVLTGAEYLPLNKEIDKYKRIRKKRDNIIVTLGGSDTYGVTIKVINILKKLDKKATVLIGPSFEHREELRSVIDDRFTVKESVPSLIEEFQYYALAITGGGVTPFEANASGLPCIVVASELHEIEIAKFLEKTGSSVFAGYHERIDKKEFDMDLDIEKMSLAGLETFKTDGVENIFNEISRL